MRVNARERLFFSHLVSLVLCLAKSVSTACSRSKWFSDDVDSRSLIVTFKQLCNLLVDIKRTSVREMGLTREMCRPRYRHVNDVKTFTAARKGHMFLRKISPVYIFLFLSLAPILAAHWFIALTRRPRTLPQFYDSAYRLAFVHSDEIKSPPRRLLIRPS